jgi:hypothetical protein
VLRRGGLTVRSGAKTGVVTAIQRFGSNLALNVHLHMLVPDGAYTFEHDRPRFHRIPAPSHEHLQQLLDALIARITRTLVRAGALIEDPLLFPTLFDVRFPRLFDERDRGFSRATSPVMGFETVGQCG